MEQFPNEPDLERFVQAQEGSYARVLAELRAGRKASHWIWFVFPQVWGLGHSPMSQRYAISGEAEARAYLAHPVLGARLEECTRLMLEAPGTSAEAILGGIDAVKFRSSMTLFAAVAPPDSPFARALVKYFAGRADQLTLDRLGHRA